MVADSLQITAKAAKPKKPRGPGRPFRKGHSGNPKGRARGSRNSKTLAAELLLDGEAEALMRKTVELALGGDTTALKLCVDRIVAPRRERALRIQLPPLDGPDDLVAVVGALIAATADGRVTPSEAAALGQTIDTAIRAIDASDFNDRIVAMQQQVAVLIKRHGPHPDYIKALTRGRGLT